MLAIQHNIFIRDTWQGFFLNLQYYNLLMYAHLFGDHFMLQKKGKKKI